MDSALHALGVIEVKGKATAIACGDEAAKSANIELVGYERAGGNGWIAVYIRGDISSVKAGIEAALEKAKEFGQKGASSVLPNPYEELLKILPFLKDSKKKKNEDEMVRNDLKSENNEMAPKEVTLCNLCGDPDCKRKKGEPKQDCIHFTTKFGGEL